MVASWVIFFETISVVKARICAIPVALKRDDVLKRQDGHMRRIIRKELLPNKLVVHGHTSDERSKLKWARERTIGHLRRNR
jgi:hypothetical protein